MCGLYASKLAGAGFVTKLSSAGLVYKHFGKEIVADAMSQPSDSPAVETTWLAVYKYFMEAVDGIDNGKGQLLVYTGPCVLAPKQSSNNIDASACAIHFLSLSDQGHKAVLKPHCCMCSCNALSWCF